MDQQDRIWDRELNRFIPDVTTMSKTLTPLSRAYDTLYGLYNSAHNHFTKDILSITSD